MPFKLLRIFNNNKLKFQIQKFIIIILINKFWKKKTIIWLCKDELIFISLFYFKNKICKNTIATFIFKRNQEIYRKFKVYSLNRIMNNKIKFFTAKLNGISRDE